MAKMKCPHCGRVQGVAQWCRRCGKRLTAGDVKGKRLVTMTKDNDGYKREYRELSEQSEWALRLFCERQELGKEQMDMLARLSGRGYRPPTTPDGWLDIYKFISDNT